MVAFIELDPANAADGGKIAVALDEIASFATYRSPDAKPGTNARVYFKHPLQFPAGAAVQYEEVKNTYEQIRAKVSAVLASGGECLE